MLLATGVLMIFNVDIRFEEDLAKDTSLPAVFVDPTRSLENSTAVQKRLASLRPTSRFVTAQQKVASQPVSTAAEREVAIPGVTDALAQATWEPPQTSPTTRTGSTRPATVR